MKLFHDNSYYLLAACWTLLACCRSETAGELARNARRAAAICRKPIRMHGTEASISEVHEKQT